MQSIHPLRLKAKTTKYATTVPEERVPSRVLVFYVSAMIFSSLSAQRLFNFLVCAQTCATLLWQFRKHDASCVCVCVCVYASVYFEISFPRHHASPYQCSVSILFYLEHAVRSPERGSGSRCFRRNRLFISQVIIKHH